MTYIDSVDVLSCLDCIGWLTAPEEFVCGRRDSLGKEMRKFTSAEILPGCSIQHIDNEEAASKAA